MNEELRREIIFTPAFDRRDKKQGIHGTEMRCYLHGKRGVVQFVLFTNWQLPHVTEEFKNSPHRSLLMEPIPADLGYHSYTPMYEGHEPLIESCELLNGHQCFYGGSGLEAKRIFDTLVSKGGEAMWTDLEDYYNEIFGD